jgi:tRNA dimethylallyltransferase
MESRPDQSPLVVIVGPTASGKSALALSLAAKFNGEIISADSRTLYKGMDIGTAKPTLREQKEVLHHLLDQFTIDTQVTAADFKLIAQAAIEEVALKKRLPFLVGGTGLYVDAVLYDFNFADRSNPAARAHLQTKTIAELQSELARRDIPLPSNEKNPRHLVRQLETGGIVSLQTVLRKNTLIIGIDIDSSTLRSNIKNRVEMMFRQGLEEEVRDLVDSYGWSGILLQTIGYKEFAAYFAGELSLSEVEALIEKNTIRYAKRQRTWFRRNKSIHWIQKEEQAVDLITSLMNK